MGATINCLENGFGSAQFPRRLAAILLGRPVRVGLEDNVSYRKGELAGSNAPLVEYSAQTSRETNREAATPDEARRILLLGRG